MDIDEEMVLIKIFILDIRLKIMLLKIEFHFNVIFSNIHSTQKTNCNLPHIPCKGMQFNLLEINYIITKYISDKLLNEILC